MAHQRYFVWTFLWVLLLEAFCSPARAEKADWWTIDREVVKQLFTKGVGSLSDELSRQETGRDSTPLLKQLNVFVRAGHEKRALQAIDRLTKAKDRPERHDLDAVANFLIEREQWRIAKHLLERFPHLEPDMTHAYIRHWAETGNVSSLDKWLAAKAKKSGFWLQQYIFFHVECGTEEGVLNSLESEVKKHPADVHRATRYLLASTFSGKPINIDWMVQVCKPELAVDSYELGNSIGYRNQKAAIHFLELSLRMPFTQADLQSMEKRLTSFQVKPAYNPETLLRLWTKSQLAEMYQATGQPDKAQIMVQELSEFPLYFTSHAKLAGEVQRTTGARVIENRIRESEQENKDSVDYWLARANYYAGRKEQAEAVAAYERALQLAPADLEVQGKGGGVRLMVLNRYFRYLEQNQETQKAVLMMKKELESVPYDTEFASRLIAMLNPLDKSTSYLSYQEALPWDYLAGHTRWSHTEERLLWSLARQVTTNELEAFWTRAIALTRNTHPTRAKTLGWVMTRMDAHTKAIPILQDAISRMENQEEQSTAAFNLMEAYLATRSWQNAEKMLPLAYDHLTSREITEWYGRIALLAAEMGDEKDALRVWKERANLDRTDLRGMESLVQHGLKESLRAFYRQVQQADPQCTIPAAALKRLE